MTGAHLAFPQIDRSKTVADMLVRRAQRGALGSTAEPHRRPIVDRAARALLGGGPSRWRLAHRCRTNENPATGGQRWPVHHPTAHQARPGRVPTATRAARPVPDEHRAEAEPMTARAALRRAGHPRAVGAADKDADRGHESIILLPRHGGSSAGSL
jgi:hypothetical protein